MEKNAKIAAMAAVLKKRLATSSNGLGTPEMIRAFAATPSRRTPSRRLRTVGSPERGPIALFGGDGDGDDDARRVGVPDALSREFHAVQLRQLEKSVAVSLQRRAILHAAVRAVHDSEDCAQLGRTVAADAVEHLHLSTAALIFCRRADASASATASASSSSTLWWHNGRSATRSVEVDTAGGARSTSVLARALCGAQLVEWSTALDGEALVRPATDFAWISEHVRRESHAEVDQLMVVCVREIGASDDLDAPPPVALLACARLASPRAREDTAASGSARRVARFTPDETLSARTLAEAAAAVLSRFARRRERVHEPPRGTPASRARAAAQGAGQGSRSPAQRARISAAVEDAVTRRLEEAVGAARRDTMRACERDMRRATQRIAALQLEREQRRSERRPRRRERRERRHLREGARRARGDTDDVGGGFAFAASGDGDGDEEAGAEGEFSFMYRYILRASCSQFDSLPLTYLPFQPERRAARWAAAWTSKRSSRSARSLECSRAHACCAASRSASSRRSSAPTLARCSSSTQPLDRCGSRRPIRVLVARRMAPKSRSGA